MVHNPGITDLGKTLQGVWGHMLEEIGKMDMSKFNEVILEEGGFQ